MGGPTYTIEQLEHLRDSPLVQKPDGLPAIEQWMELPADQNNNINSTTNRRPRSGNHGDTAPTGEQRSERPSLINVGSMGHFGRRPSMQPEDTVLGPPKLSFTSASRAAKGGDNSEKRGITSIDGDQLGDRFPSSVRQRGERWTRDRDTEGTREKSGFANGGRRPREEGEGWQNVKGRKSLGQEDFDRGFGRNGDRDKVNKDGEADNADSGTRRAGAGREKFERWGRREDTKEAEGNRFGGTGQGGWRDRERDRGDRGDRDRDRDREWTRGGNRVEEDPEWMDTPRNTKEKKQAHTQEEFQRWKEQMRAKDTAPVEKEEPKPDSPATDLPSASTAPANTLSKPALTPSTDVLTGALFGNWGTRIEPTANAPEAVKVKPKTAQKSKFATMFAKPEEPAVHHEPPPPNFLASLASTSPPPGVNGTDDEDKQGFQRILQMLGGTNISGNQQPLQGLAPPMNGTRHGAVPLEHHSQSPPEERLENRPNRQPAQRSLEQQAMLENILAPRPSAPETRPPQNRFNVASPDNGHMEQYGLPRPESNRPHDDYPIQQPPSRNSSAQDANLHALLNSRTREVTNRDFLLNLMQQPSRATPPQPQHHNLPRPGPGPGLENPNMAYFDQGPPRPQGQPKGRGGPPPGFMDESARFENEMMRHDRIRDMQQRFGSGREDPMLQRHNSIGDVPRQMTNMGIPSQPVPDMQFMGGRPHGMPPTPTERPNIAPPPGFGGPAGMRPPPPGIPQGMPPLPGGTPLPPGFGPPSAGMRGMFPGGPGPNMPPGPPQGYFPPNQGFGGPPDPRMMMGQFDQFGGPRQGRPPNMY